MARTARGPLGAEVYWRRRVLVLALAFVLVLGIARLLGSGSDASDGGSPGAGDSASAAQAGAGTTLGAAPTTDASLSPASPTPSTAKQIRRAERKARRQAARQASEAAAAQVAAAQASAVASASAAAQAALQQPQGPCSDTDVVVTASVPSPIAGSDVVIDLDLGTRFSPACSWHVSADTVAVKITSGSEAIWSTQQCPSAVPEQDVVLHRAVPTTVQVTWKNAKRSDAKCSDLTDWALPGFYHVLSAALAGEPTDVQFELTKPAAPQVTRTAEPTASAKPKKGAGSGQAQ